MGRFTKVLFFLFALFMTISESTLICPMRCLCFRTTVRCMFLHLEKIPEVPTDTTILDLRFNRIREIEPLQFHNLSELTTLLLNNNQITQIRSGAFHGLTNLKHLSLYKNRIREIDPLAFSPTLLNLEQLYLHYNLIATLDRNQFKNLGKLERLFLQNNKIQRIPFGAFDNLGKLQRLRLDGNALVCDCGIMGLSQMLAHKETTVATAAFCQLPGDLKMSVVSMKDSGVLGSKCRKPIMLEEPSDIEVKFGGTVYFRCRADGEPLHTDIIWVQNDNEINSNLPPPRYSIMEDGTLMIENIQDEDLGSYECIARSDAGEVKSRRAVASSTTKTVKVESNRGKVRRRPRFLRVPMDQEVTEGDTLVLHCEATDNDTVVEWEQEGRRGVVVGGKYGGVEITPGTLKIPNVTIEFGGIWKCSARNEVGNVSAVARVGVTAMVTPPKWLVTPSESEKTLETGENVVLRCEATGRPQPEVKWFLNGRQLRNNSDRVQILGGGTRLEITSASLDNHHGELACRAENSGGSIETITNVKIVSGSPPVFTHDWTGISSELQGSSSTLTLPCSASTFSTSGGANSSSTVTIIWRKDRLTLSSDGRVTILPKGTLVIKDFSSSDAGTYECSAFNDHGFITSDQIRVDEEKRIKVVSRNQQTAERRRDDDDDIVLDAYKQAKYDVERAENETVRGLFERGSSGKAMSPMDLLRLTRFPRGPQRFLARPAEIYERALNILKEQVDRGMRINVTKTFSYDHLLTTSQLETLGKLSGCISHRRPVAACNGTLTCFNRKYRTIDGTCNNLNHSMWGASYTPFQRLRPAEYENGFNLPKGWTVGKLYNGFPLPPARTVTNKIITTDAITPDANYTHMLMQWGQFLDHDLDHALPSLSIEAFGERVSCRRTCENVAPCFPMQAPAGDPRIRTRRCMEFTRSAGVCGSGVTSILFDSIQQREQVNQLTSFIDASQVYGSSEEELLALRSPTDPIYLRNGIFMVPDKPLMPFATDDNFVDCRRNFRESDIGCFIAGDIRANEQVGLLAMHTLWFRQHNFIARQLRHANPFWRDETVFQETRKIVGAQMMHITYSQWLPKIVGVMGMEELGEYRGYDGGVNPTITNGFATAAMRFGHTLINPTLRRLDENFQTIREGDIPLRQAFFAPWRLVEEGGVDPIMRGLFHTPAKLKKSSEFLNSHLTNDLFGHAHLIALDLASMNIQRSRDHGLPFYNDYRVHCGLPRARSFDDLKNEIPDGELRAKLQEVYRTPDNIELWVGGIAEQPSSPDARVGPTFRCLLVDQFRRLRDGDRFWYENEDVFTAEQIREIKRVTLARVLCDTGDSLREVREDVFSMRSNVVNCNLVPGMRLGFWTADDCCGGSGDAAGTFCRTRFNEIQPRRRKRDGESWNNETLRMSESI